MKRIYRNILFLTFLLLATVSVKAQVTVKAELDSVQMQIGAQVHMTISAMLPEDGQVVFPSLRRCRDCKFGRCKRKGRI